MTSEKTNFLGIRLGRNLFSWFFHGKSLLMFVLITIWVAVLVAECWEHLVSGDSENSAELHRSVVQRQYLAKEGIIYHFSKKAHFFIFNPHPHSQHPGKVQKKLIFPWSLLQIRCFLYFLSSINKMRTHFMALSFLGLNSQTGEERRKLLDDSLLSSKFSFSSRPGSDPFFGKQPRTGSVQRGD